MKQEKTKQKTKDPIVIGLAKFEVKKEDEEYGVSFTIFDEVMFNTPPRNEIEIRKDDFSNLDELMAFVKKTIEERIGDF